MTSSCPTCSVRSRKWIKGVLFRMDHPRHSSAVIYLNGCHGKYTNKRGELIDAPCKSLVYLPYGSEYTVLNFDCGSQQPDAYLVEFNVICDGEKAAFSDSPFVDRERERISRRRCYVRRSRHTRRQCSPPPPSEAAVYHRFLRSSERRR